MHISPFLFIFMRAFTVLRPMTRPRCRYMQGFIEESGKESVYGECAMVTTRDIIRKLWDAQGYGNIAVYSDGSALQVPPGDSGEAGGKQPVALFKAIPLVGEFPMLDNALGDAELLDGIERTLREQGMEIERGT